MRSPTEPTSRREPPGRSWLRAVAPGCAARYRVRCAGFTLLELTVALTIMALAAAVMAGSLRLAAQSWERGGTRIEESANARLARDFLRTHLAQHYPLRLRKVPEQPLWFQGEAESLRFASFLPDRVSAGGLFLVRLAVMQVQERRQLVLLRVIPDGPVAEEASFDGADVSVLAPDVESVRIRYFGREADNQDPRWFDRWNDRQRLPLLVRIDVLPRGAPAWPAIVVEPRLAIEAGCASWNPAAQRCTGS
jgi:general secretion pathway protein J